MATAVHLELQVTRRGDGYQGTLTRPGDRLCLPFTGVLELPAALARLTAPDGCRENRPGELATSWSPGRMMRNLGAAADPPYNCGERRPLCSYA
jgi:hypothetical protein